MVGLVVKKLNRTDQYNCSLLNKKWLIGVQPNLYESVEVEFSKKDKAPTKTLTDSVFGSNKFVKVLIFKDEVKVNDSSDNNHNDEILYRLVRECPRMQYLVLKHPLNNNTQPYFLQALNDVNSWKLKRVPDLSSFTHYRYYIDTVELMQNSLEEVIIQHPNSRMVVSVFWRFVQS